MRGLSPLRPVAGLDGWKRGKSGIAAGGAWESIDAVEPPHENLPNFGRVELAFSKRSTVDLVRSYLVLRVCGWEWLVDRAEVLLNISNDVLGKSFTNYVVKKTFFAQFCAAENEKGLAPVMQSLESSGVSGILDYAAEADLDQDDQADSDHFVAGPEATLFPGSDLDIARKYPYEGERACDAAADIFLNCIDTASAVAQHKNTGSNPFAAIKVTALGNPKLLKRISEMITETKLLFQRMEDSLDRENVGSLSLDEWKLAFSRYFDLQTEEEVEELFWSTLHSRPDEWNFETMGQPRVDMCDWARSMNIKVVAKLVQNCKEAGPLSRVTLSDQELALSKALLQRLDKIAAHANAKNVSLMIDAEQTYFQPCIDANVLRLQRLYNKSPPGATPTIFGTYQCYLKDTDTRLGEDLERSKREGWRFAAKLVRGAYMVSERKLAAEQGRESPVRDTIEDTHASYNRNIELLMLDPNAEVMIASHNRESCENAAELMMKHGIDRKEGGGVFWSTVGHE